MKRLIKNNKAEANDTAILISIVTFQAFILIMLGFINVDSNDITTETKGASLWDFSVNIITNITQLGWANLIIFFPLNVAIIYIIVKIIRGGG